MDRKSGKTLNVIILVVAIIAAVVFGLIMLNYLKSDDEYNSVRKKYVHKQTESTDGSSPAGNTGAGIPLIEDADPPLKIDWKALKAINPDIVGWVYVDAEPSISYPIVQSDNNSYYLHRTYKKRRLYAGSIFEDCINSPDFSDAQTIVYGHNMKSGSMFGRLQHLLNQKVYDRNPYFWILTPAGDYRYHIYSVFTTDDRSAVYNIYKTCDDSYFAWMKQMKDASSVQNRVPLVKTDQSVVLSTCKGAGTQYRNVVIGRICSTKRPQKK